VRVRVRGPGAGVKARRCCGVSCSTCWRYRRRCREAPTSSRFDSPGDKAKVGTRVRGAEGVHTSRPVHTVPCAGGRIVGTGPSPFHRARAQVEAYRHFLSWDAPP